ncbi:MAG TPA: hypothetical protein VFM37_16865 [Pseudonocardiaceae bacterium]|nr:hypothetical protein [Pseudonocardiaceae bacterium]
MAEPGPITDEYVVRVLRPLVLATRPVLEALREADPTGLRHRVSEDRLPVNFKRRLLNRVPSLKLPGTPAWAAMTSDSRCDWWLNRVGRFVALFAALPGFAGAAADRLPLQDALGAVGQSLLLCAIAGEYGVRDVDEQVLLLAHILLRRDVSAELAARSAKRSAEDERKAAELTSRLDVSGRKPGRPTVRAIAGTVWRLGRALWALGDELARRPQGRIYHKALGKFPMVGILGDYLGERHALRKVARAGRAWIIGRRAPASDLSAVAGDGG